MPIGDVGFINGFKLRVWSIIITCFNCGEQGKVALKRFIVKFGFLYSIILGFGDI